MEQEKTIRLLLRQLNDIQAQAEKILTGEKSNEAIEGFARYSAELKDYIMKNVKNSDIKSYLIKIPNVNYSRTNVKFWQYIILPAWWISLFYDYMARNKTVAEINEAKGKYANLEFLIKRISDNK